MAKLEALFLSKINKIKKSSSKRCNNHFSDELVKILTADSILSDVYLDDKLYADMIIDEGLARPYDGKTKKGWC